MANNNVDQPATRWLRSWTYWRRRLLPSVDLTAFRIVLLYSVFGLAALLLSDVLFVRYFSEPLLSQVQALKGGVEVFMTAGFIFLFTNRRETQLKRSLDRLDQKREELDVLHRVLRHNLRNDLNVIIGRAEMIDDELQEPVRTHRDIILETGDDVLHYTDQAVKIRNISARNGSLQPFKLADMIPDLVAGLSEDEARGDITVDVPDSVVIEANPMFDQALEELVRNAIEHNTIADEPQIAIDVDRNVPDSHLVEIRVADNGPGIPRSELDPLEEGKEDQLLHISGMGLWFVKWTIRNSRGQISFDVTDQGTTVTISVPKSPEMLSTPLSSIIPGQGIRAA